MSTQTHSGPKHKTRTKSFASHCSWCVRTLSISIALYSSGLALTVIAAVLHSIDDTQALYSHLIYSCIFSSQLGTSSVGAGVAENKKVKPWLNSSSALRLLPPFCRDALDLRSGQQRKMRKQIVEPKNKRAPIDLPHQLQSSLQFLAGR